ncbi:Asp-tRNA(Asn)/Glu-tRNA(Gln) amidotransferase subunit GatB [Dehalococcoidia bacterium]|nr:Asp-tRNA(Asn)/Glu-tRNA(Gln) amidotransferase subunit GatB [Dehalococcoidia bacterium]MCL0078733.1 Asp-tRNA(Asn)/Glu-tRNA(Gln) amidotransferase subunit GatB [Dehalococcoidia bacterium]MCL0079444.1 Asp-tRNA(Asn)/Glu-tRNA(Gln) amidotransferase subunit GatB [Dehalococcoidia bacterium]MCL0098152.1 Asp-tRNA(Asn)/Glu-tRNA(Gln) amidotransferase subunit GatB [Dehalococcoidia bacterium]
MKYETVIGLEVHAQLLTSSKMFCGCPTDYANSLPNTHVCPVCLGMPGVLPTINGQAVEFTVMTALALNCAIPDFSKFDRKNYPYPDLMKGYQISQYDVPLSHDGWLEIETDGRKKRVGITRVHLEEDVAKLLSRTDPSGETYSLVDVNRAGVPLMEIVSDPDLSSPDEARVYLMRLHSLLRYLGVSTGNMEEGSFRCDANISLRSVDGQQSFPKVEVKNMNSFKSVYLALRYEEDRQRRVIEEGGSLIQETRGWDDDKGITVAQRSKEYAHDYRYFPEPDLLPLTLSPEWVEGIRSGLPELPVARRDRFMVQYGLSAYDADLLTGSRDFADYFESCIGIASPEQAAGGRAKAVANWMLGELLRLLNVEGAGISQSKITPQHLAGMLDLIDRGILSTTLAKQVFEEMFNTGRQASEIVAQKGLTLISGAEEIAAVIDQVLRDNARAAADFRGGKEQALKFLVGQVMKGTKGRAKPDLVGRLIREKV